MGKIALLVSREEMLYQAHNLLQEKAYDVGIMRVIKTGEAVSEARRSVAEGAAIIIARGLQASLIKQYTNIPVAEIMLTAQEMALLVVRAKQILKKKNPVIGVIGFENMFCDMSYFDTIYEIDLRTYFAEKGSELEAAAEQAVADGVDLMIGGDTVVEVAGRHKIPSLFLSITEDSMRNAFEMAERMAFAMRAEKRNAAQMETLLDYSFNGITRIDADGRIRDINPIMEDILKKTRAEVQGQAAGQVYRELNQESLRQVLNEGRDSYSLFMQINGTSMFALIAPVVIDDRVDGAILTCHRMKKISAPKAEKRPHGLMALGEFDDLIQDSAAMQGCVRLSKLYAMSEKPVLILGEAGTEKRMLAQSIHNAGLRRGKPFIEVSCDGAGDDAQFEMIFGDKGAAALAGGGSVLIEEIGALTKANQYRLYQLIRHRLRSSRGVVRYPGADVRIIAASHQPLLNVMREGRFREDLYYLLAGLMVKIPPLRERKEDLRITIETGIRTCCENYSRFHVLTRGALERLLEYPWNGNLLQVENFCERLILTANKRSLDEIAVSRVLADMDQEAADSETLRPGTGKFGNEKEYPEEAARILKTLREMRGNREKTAQTLEMSKATLWRRMKEYGIEWK